MTPPTQLDPEAGRLVWKLTVRRGHDPALQKRTLWDRGMTVQRKPNKRLLVLLVISLFMFGLWIAYVRGDIGMSERAMCLENGDSMEPGDSFHSQIGQSMAVFLHYNLEENDHHLDIYVKREKSIGWHFRYGSAVAGAQHYLKKLTLENNQEYVLAYLDPEHTVSQIEIEKDDGNSEVLTHLTGKPFAYVMDKRWDVTVYDGNGDILRAYEERM